MELKKSSTLTKKILYLFGMHSYLDKQENRLKNLIPHSLCFSCETEFETWNHLVLHCEKTKITKQHLNFKNWTEIWSCENPLTWKLVVALLISSWSENEGKYLKYIKTRCTNK